LNSGNKNLRESKNRLNSLSGNNVKWFIGIASVIIFILIILSLFHEEKRTKNEFGQNQSEEKSNHQNKIDTTTISKVENKFLVTEKRIRQYSSSTEKKKTIEEVLPVIADSVQQIVTHSENEIDSNSTQTIIPVKEKQASKPLLKLFPISNQIINEGEKFRRISFTEYLLDSIDRSNLEWKVSNNKFLLVENKTDSTFTIKTPSDDFYGTDTVTVTAFYKSDSIASVNTVFTVRQVDLINRFPFKPVKDVLVTGVTDVFALIINPVSWENNDYLTFGAVVLGNASLFAVDKKVHEEVSKGKSYKESDILNFGKYYGETLTSQVASLSVTATGIILCDKKITRLGLELFESYIITDRLVYIFKYLFGRDRPSANNDNMKFNPFDSRKNNMNALPSGHAALSFSLSTVLSSLTDDPYLKSLFYIPAVITCVSRVYQNYHWTSDVFLGATMGYFVGSFIVNRHNKIFKDNISFSFDQQGRIGLFYKF